LDQVKVKYFYMRIFRIGVILFTVILIGQLMSVDFAFASNTDGTIDPNSEGYKYAWGENIGWVNFGCDNCNVHVTDSGLSGYALSENIGWIYLGDITNNNGGGTLLGYAWSENTGWIKFNPINGGVIINSSGEFTGSALGENIGWIIFGGDYKVKTDWRPASSRTTEEETTTSGGGGGSLPPEAFYPVTPPEGGFNVLINDDVAETDSRKVSVTLRGGIDTGYVQISEDPQFPKGYQVSYNSSLAQVLISFTLSKGGGAKTVYTKFCTRWGRCSDTVSDSIIYIETPIVEKIKEAPKEIIEEVKKISEKIKEIIKPKPKEEEKKPELPPIEEVVTQEAPLSLQGKWQLLPSEPIREFVLAPLPKEIRVLAKKFPELEKTFTQIGIKKITDIERLKTGKFTLPGLTEALGLPVVKIEPGEIAMPRGVPIAELSPQMKKDIPIEIVFAKTGGEIIDFNTSLIITEKGRIQQKITTISGKPLQLTVKPEKPVKSVKGYVVFKSTKPRESSLNLPSGSLAASLFFTNPVFAKPQEQPVRVEEKLVLLEFEYTDSDGDGIYTAEIQAPVVEGEYEIITVMDYEDPELGVKEIRLITVIDPEGYIFERDGDKETRIPGAIVSIYWLNSETKQYELWPAKEYQQENPQTTDVRGTYSFLVPEGYYYLKVEAPGYLIYDGKPFQVKEGSGVHVNIELKTKYWWLKIVDWKTLALIVVILFLIYNFYRDKIREKILNKSKKLI